MPELDIGVHHGIDFVSYADLPYVNSGVVTWGRTSMKHMQAAHEHKIASKDTEDRKLGRDIHCAILEEERYRQDYLIASKCVAPVASRDGELCGNSAKLVSAIPRHPEDQYAQVDHCLKAAGWSLRDTSASGSRYYERNGSHLRASDHPPNEKTQAWMNDVRCSEIAIGAKENVMSALTPFVDGVTFKPLLFWYCGVKGHAPHGAFPPQEFVSEEEAERIEAIREALRSHEAMKLLRGESWSEVTCVWEHLGLLRKCRIDRYSIKPKHRIIDLKKCKPGNGSREDCEKAILNNGYYRQMAGNVEAIEALTGETPEAIWLFIEDDYPFDVNIIPADSETIAIGKWENHDIISRYAAATKKDDCRGYIFDARVIRYGGLPDWYKRQCRELGIGTEHNGDDQEFAEFGEPAVSPEPAAVD